MSINEIKCIIFLSLKELEFKYNLHIAHKFENDTSITSDKFSENFRRFTKFEYAVYYMMYMNLIS